MRIISFVIPCYRSYNTISDVVAEIDRTMSAHENDDYEIILVNDCSPDNTIDVLKNLAENNSHVMAIDMAKNFGQHAALLAGIRHTTGDIVVCLDDDGQTPPSEAYNLIDKLAEFDVCYASYEGKKHSAFRNFGSSVNDKMLEIMLDKPKTLYASSYFAMKRYIADEIVKYTNPYPYIMGLVLRTTNSITSAPVNHKERASGRSGYSISKLLSLWINGFTAFSVKPLRIASLMGILCAVIGGIFSIWAVINKLTNPAAPIGWTTLIIVLLIIGGMILFVLGMLGEYVGRMYISMNNSPQYVIKAKYGHYR
ncbi:MAG: glycosyltransferase family 2 protein [Lachnospiraceae bacterium]|nr:glycosyltransferase family 2 protein [Lachnospiraceae bacterium]